MKKTNTILVALALCASVVLADPNSTGPSGGVAGGQSGVSIDLAFATHLDMDLPEQDVYIEREPGSGEVWRVTKGDNDMRAPLYKTAVETKHDPFDPSALGPHAIGEPLGLTLGEWLKHQGTGVYTYQDGVGTLAHLLCKPDDRCGVDTIVDAVAGTDFPAFADLVAEVDLGHVGLEALLLLHGIDLGTNGKLFGNRHGERATEVLRVRERRQSRCRVSGFDVLYIHRQLAAAKRQYVFRIDAEIRAHGVGLGIDERQWIVALEPETAIL